MLSLEILFEEFAMRRLLVLGISSFTLSVLVGCGGNVNDQTVNAPPMGPVDVPAGAENPGPPSTYIDSSAYAEANVDTSGDPGQAKKK
jgi:hypothetical protein